MLMLPTLLVAALLTPPASEERIESFWRTTRERLVSEPIDAQVERIPEAVPYQVFQITLRSLDGVRIRSRLALPVQGEAPARPWPVIVTTPGYSGRQQGVMLSECQRGYAILQIFPRGQGESAELWNIDGPDKLTWRLDQPEGAYYQVAYADVIRAIDYATSRKDLDGRRIALVGTSQGGGFALAVGALDDRVTAVVAHVPFLCDFRLAARTPNSLAKRCLDRAGRNDDAALNTLDYFDALRLAPRVKIPVLLSAGGKDELCPVATIQSVHDRLAGEKQLKVYPDLTHTSCVDFYNLTWSWLDSHLKGDGP